LLELFRHQTINLGVIGIARSRIESVEEIASHLQKALNHIDKERLMAAPDPKHMLKATGSYLEMFDKHSTALSKLMG
jgi:hypothetical protein